MIKATIVLSVAAWIIPRLRARSAAERHLLWAIGLLAADAHPCRDAHLEQRLNRLSRTLGLTRTIRLLQTSHDIVPATWGWRRPRILLPARAAAWLEERAHVVLAHEMAHIRRRDWIV